MQMPLWKRVVIGGLCAAALLTAAPNIFLSQC